MARKDADYAALAAHLNPGDPTAGAEAIDLAILETQRMRWRPHNRARALFLAGNMLVALGAASLGLRACNWLGPTFASTPVAGLAAITSISDALLIVALAIGVLVLSSWLDEAATALRPFPPQPIYSWLRAQGKVDLLHWHAVYWSHEKIKAHRREILGFVCWRKALRPQAQYPTVTERMQRRAAPPDLHWAYLSTEEGRADSEAYLVSFEQRMDAWYRLSSKAVLSFLAVVGFLIWLPTYPPTAAGELLRTAALLAFMLLCTWLAFGVGTTVPMRWLPTRVRRYWFRSPPQEATEFRDHMIALSR